MRVLVIALGIFIFSFAQVSAEFVYTGIEGTTQYQSKPARAKYYIDTDGIIDVKNGFSVDVVEELVDFKLQRYVPISYVYLYQNGEWVFTSVMRDKIFAAANTNVKKKIGERDLGGGNFGTTIWSVSAPYTEKIKAKVIQRTKKNQSVAQVQFSGDSNQLIAEADAKYKAKDYGTARQLFEQAVSANPKDYHAHDLLARSLYREKSKTKDYDRIVDEIQLAVNLAPDNEKKADCLMFLSKVYSKLGMNNLFNAKNKVDYAGMSTKCQEMAQKLRQTNSAVTVSVPRASASTGGGSSQEILIGTINKQRAFMLPGTVQYTGSKVQPDTMTVQVKLLDADDNAKNLTLYFKLNVATYQWSINQKDWYKLKQGADNRSGETITTICNTAWQTVSGGRKPL